MILYHCTDACYKNKILKEGLLLEKSNFKDKIFLSKAPEYIYGNTCFAVDTEGLLLTQTINLWEFICNKSIPIDKIKYHGFCEIDD